MHDAALESLENCFHDLHKTAVGVVSDHWEQILAIEKKSTHWTDKSTLQLASYRLGNHIQLKWVGIRWYGAAKTRKTVKVNITRSKGDLTYTMAKLKPWCKEWELPIVEETERKLTIVRRQAFFLTRSIMALRNAKAIATNSPIEEVELPDDDESIN